MNTSGRALSGLFAALFASLAASVAIACPFCGSVQPTFAERRQSAAVCALGEAIDERDGGWRFRIHQVQLGGELVERNAIVNVTPAAKFQPGDLAFLLGSPGEMDGEPSAWRWEAIEVQAESALYFSNAPDMRELAAERMKYFVDFLESGDDDIASDAYAELGRAPLEAVESVAGGDAMVARLRSWVLSEDMPNERRGLYGLMLGLAQDADERSANAQVLREAIDEPREDFRAGFDGLLAGYLLLEPDEALEWIEERYIANADARPGDTRHALNALRFCVEYKRGPEKDRILETLHHGLSRKTIAAEAIVDLARWKDWTAVDTVAALYERASGSDDGPLRRAVIGYLKACPDDAAAEHLERIRANDPEGVAEVERRLNLPIDR